MAIIDNKISSAITTIQDLPRKATPDVLTYAQLQAKFDEAPELLRQKLNSLIDSIISDYASKSEINNIVLGQVLDGSLTEAKMANDMKKNTVGGIASYNLFKTTSDDYTAFKNTKGQADGLASLGSDGKLPSGQLPTLFTSANGSFADTTTNIAASSTYTKTIPLGFAAKQGTITIRGLGSVQSCTNWVKIDFTNVQNNSHSITPTNLMMSKSVDSLLSGTKFDSAGANIRVEDCYISGNNLIIAFRNMSASVAVLNVTSALWEVEG